MKKGGGLLPIRARTASKITSTHFASLPSQRHQRSCSSHAAPLPLHKKRLGMKIDGSMCLGLILLFLFPSAQTPGTFLAQIMHREFIVPNPPPGMSVAGLPHLLLLCHEFVPLSFFENTTGRIPFYPPFLCPTPQSLKKSLSVSLPAAFHCAKSCASQSPSSHTGSAWVAVTSPSWRKAARLLPDPCSN